MVRTDGQTDRRTYGQTKCIAIIHFGFAVGYGKLLDKLLDCVQTVVILLNMPYSLMPFYSLMLFSS